MNAVSNKTLFRSLPTLAAAGLGGFLFSTSGVPLGWLLGALTVTGLLSVIGLPTAVLPRSRQAGQWIIGCAMGFQVTPAVLQQIAGLSGIILFGAIASIATGMIAGLFLTRTAGISPVTAFFSTAPAGVIEMAFQGKKYGGEPETIALAHTLRIALTVTIIPFALIGFGGLEPQPPAETRTDPVALASALAAGLAGAFLLARMKVPNGFILGSMIACAVLAGSGLVSEQVPGWLVSVAQIVLGTALGHQFQRSALVRMGGRLGFLVAAVLIMIGLQVLLAFALAAFTGADLNELVLALAPGGIAEMVITAKALGISAPLIATFHIFRIFVTLATLSYSYRLFQRIAGRSAPG